MADSDFCSASPGASHFVACSRLPSSLRDGFADLPRSLHVSPNSPAVMSPVLVPFWICQVDLQDTMACDSLHSLSSHMASISEIDPFNLTASGSLGSLL